MATAITSYKKIASNSSGDLYAALCLTYSTSSTDTDYTVSITGASVLAYATSSAAKTAFGDVKLVKNSSDTYAKKNCYFNSTNHTSSYNTSATKSLNISTSSSSPGSTSLDDGTNFSYTITKTTSSQTVQVRLWGSIKLKVLGLDIVTAYNSESSPVISSVTVPALASYTVTLNANGGTNGSITSFTKWYGINTTFPLSTQSPTRSGWQLMGWGSSSSSTSISYAIGATYSANASATYYAVWRKIITLTYNANGGTAGSTTSQSATVYNATTSASFTIPSAATPTKSGYTFLGWSTSSTATSASYSEGSSYSFSSSTTLYAIWRKQITLTYSANGGSGAPSATSAYVYNSTTSKTFSISSTTPTKSGYTFLGWGTSSTATSGPYGTTSGKTSSITLSANTTLYAIWRKQVTLSYNANGGTGAPASQSAYMYNSDASTSLTVSSTKPTRTNWVFSKWNTNSGGTGTNKNPGDSISISANTTLYAIWTPSYNKATISNLSVIRCTSNGTADDEGTYAKVTFSWSGTKYGDTACTPSSIAIYSKQGSGSYTQKYLNSSPSGTSGTVTQIVSSYDTDKVYDIKVTVNNNGNSIDAYDVLSTAYFVIDVNKDGTAIGFFGSAPDFTSSNTDDDKGFFVYKDIKLMIDTTAASTTLDGKLKAALDAVGWSDLI